MGSATFAAQLFCCSECSVFIVSRKSSQSGAQATSCVCLCLREGHLQVPGEACCTLVFIRILRAMTSVGIGIATAFLLASAQLVLLSELMAGSKYCNSLWCQLPGLLSRTCSLSASANHLYMDTYRNTLHCYSCYTRHLARSIYQLRLSFIPRSLLHWSRRSTKEGVRSG